MARPLRLVFPFMKILVLNPFAGTTREAEHCRSVARPDTEIVFENTADVYPCLLYTSDAADE